MADKFVNTSEIILRMYHDYLNPNKSVKKREGHKSKCKVIDLPQEIYLSMFGGGGQRERAG